MASVDSTTGESLAEPPRDVRIILVVSIVLTSLGYLYRFYDHNLRAFSQVYFEWGFAERTANHVVTIMKATLGLALVAAPFRKLRYLMVPALCSLLFELLCLCLDGGAQYPWLNIPGQALRLVPFVLILMPWNRDVFIGLLKVSIAATFIGHGSEALATRAEFVDYILAFFQKVRFPIQEATADTLLHVIGTMDVLLGLHVLFYHPQQIKWVLRYMMFWGAVTALVRILYYGPVAWHEVAIRNAHALIIFLLLWIARAPQGEGLPAATPPSAAPCKVSED